MTIFYNSRARPNQRTPAPETKKPPAASKPSWFPQSCAAALSEHHSLDASLRPPLDLSERKQEACQTEKISIQKMISYY